jgi:hypothetical protein
LEIPISGLYLLAAPSTPDEIRQIVVFDALRTQSVSRDTPPAFRWFGA